MMGGFHATRNITDALFYCDAVDLRRVFSQNRHRGTAMKTKMIMAPFNSKL